MVAYDIVPASSGKPAVVQLTIKNPTFPAKGVAATYEVDISLFATAKNFSTGKPEADSRDSYRLPFTIKAAPMASHPAFGKGKKSKKVKK